jgi:hypothetical protein
VVVEEEHAHRHPPSFACHAGQGPRGPS